MASTERAECETKPTDALPTEKIVMKDVKKEKPADSGNHSQRNDPLSARAKAAQTGTNSKPKPKVGPKPSNLRAKTPEMTQIRANASFAASPAPPDEDEESEDEATQTSPSKKNPRQHEVTMNARAASKVTFKHPGRRSNPRQSPRKLATLPRTSIMNSVAREQPKPTVFEMEKMQYWRSVALQNEVAFLRDESTRRRELFQSLEEQTRAATVELKQVKGENVMLRQDLENCKTVIFDLQPHHQVPDAKLGQEYHKLQQAIAKIIEELTWELEDDEEIVDCLTKCESQYAEFFSDEGRAGSAIARQNPNALNYLLCMAIQRLLAQSVFGNYLLGLEEKQKEILENIEQCMRTAEPRRDEGKIDTWRSETFGAIIPSQEYKGCQDKIAQAIREAAMGLLEPFLPEDSELAAVSKSFHEEIILPAIRLHQDLRLSSSRYAFEYQAKVEDADRRSSGSPIFLKDLQRLELIDVDTERTLKPDSSVRYTDDGCIGHLVLVVHPQLARKASDEERKIIIRKPVVLVRLLAPVRSRGQGPLGGLFAALMGGGGD
ncbi:MAG: hypothetical protein M1819_001219 [Sarea resinae]|nr:MAG: hypothetical protein M1819_001219 [Sarea resinae]